MKHIDNLHGGGKSMLSSGLKTSATNRHGTPVRRKTLSVPRYLHRVVAEIAFREELTIRKMYEYSLTELLNCECAEYGNYDFTDTIRTTIHLSSDLVKRWRQEAHNSQTPERTLITEAVVKYIRKYYLQKHADIPEMELI